MVRQLNVLAQSGHVDNSPFIAGQSNITQVKQSWGQPDTKNTAGEGTYATYNSKHAAFGFNQNGTIFDVRSYSKQVQSLSLSDVRAILGNPNLTTTPESGQVNEIYQVNATYQLQFINMNSNEVDHVSVFDASYAKAQMELANQILSDEEAKDPVSNFGLPPHHTMDWLTVLIGRRYGGH